MHLLTEGTKAPAFKGVDQDGKPVSLAQYKGKKLVIYFYPKDNTPTCTVQACNLRDNFDALKKEGIALIGVSPDNAVSHKKFEEKFELPFTMIADPEHAVINAFGVWGAKQLYGKEYMGVHRTTFLIDEKGIIRKVFEKPKSKEHAEEILIAWKALAEPG